MFGTPRRPPQGPEGGGGGCLPPSCGQVYVVGGLGVDGDSERVWRLTLGQYTGGENSNQGGGGNDGALVAGSSSSSSSSSSGKGNQQRHVMYEELAPMRHKRSGVGVCVHNGLLYAVGGFDGTTALASVER